VASDEAIEVVSEVETEKVDSEVEVIEKVDSEDPEKVEEEVDSEEVADQTVMPQKKNTPNHNQVLISWDKLFLFKFLI